MWEIMIAKTTTQPAHSQLQLWTYSLIRGENKHLASGLNEQREGDNYVVSPIN